MGTYSTAPSFIHSYVPLPPGAEVDIHVRVTAVSPPISYVVASAVIVGVATEIENDAEIALFD